MKGAGELDSRDDSMVGKKRHLLTNVSMLIKVSETQMLPGWLKVPEFLKK